MKKLFYNINMERSRRMKKTFEIKLPFKDNILTFKFGKTLIVEIDDKRLSSNAVAYEK